MFNLLKETILKKQTPKIKYNLNSSLLIDNK